MIRIGAHHRQSRFAPTSIDLSALIACTRASEASYQTGAETDGSSAFLAWASANVLRVQNRGSRNAVFVEGARTNILLRSEDLSHATWLGSGTATSNYGTAPDGASDATRVQATSGVDGRRQNPAATPSVMYAGSVYLRAVSGTPAYQLVQGQSTATAINGTLASAYTRVRISRTKDGVPNEGLYVADGRNWVSSGGLAAGARDEILWGAQLELGAFSSSVIRTTTASVTRSADACVVADASIPTWLRSGKWTCTISLECTSAEFVAAATEMVLFAFSTGTNDRISLVLDSGAMKVRVTQGGATKVTTGAITATSRYLDITLTFDAAAGSITVSGATTGNGTTTGTTWTMQSGDVYVGNVSGGTTPYFGEVLPTVAQVP